MRAWACGECSTFRCSMPSICGVHREFGAAGDHVGGGRRADAGADGLARAGLLDRGDAVDRVLDGAVAGAAAEVSLQRPRQVLLLLVGEGRGGHDHAGGAEAALEAGGVAELPLHRVQVVRRAEALDRGHLAALGAERRRDAAVHRLAVEPHRARPAIACVATLLDAVRARVNARRSAGTGRDAARRRTRLPFTVYVMTRSRLSSVRISSA